MEKKKLKLEQLEVESFVTKMNQNEEITIDGGTATPLCIIVPAITSLITGSLLLGSCTCNPAGTACPPYPLPVIPNPLNQCSAYRRGSCGGTLGT